MTEATEGRRARFPKDVQEKLKHYVYRLVDPRDGTTFYIGRGQKNRVFHQHARREIAETAQGGRMPAREILRELEAVGLEPLRIVHLSEMTLSEAKRVETALITAYPGVTNPQAPPTRLRSA